MKLLAFLTIIHGIVAANIKLQSADGEVLAANYLDIKGLLDASVKTVANMIKGKTPEEIRKTFNIKNDFTLLYFTPEEEEQVRREDEWIEEK